MCFFPIILIHILAPIAITDVPCLISIRFAWSESCNCWSTADTRQTKQQGTHDRSKVLLVYWFLLSKLDTGLSIHLGVTTGMQLTWYSMIVSLRFSAISHTACTSASFSSHPTALDRSEIGSNSSLIPSRALRSCECGRPLMTCEQTHSNRMIFRFDPPWSPTAPSSTLSPPNLWMIDLTFPFTPCCFYWYVSWSHGVSVS